MILESERKNQIKRISNKRKKIAKMYKKFLSRKYEATGVIVEICNDYLRYDKKERYFVLKTKQGVHIVLKGIETNSGENSDHTWFIRMNGVKYVIRENEEIKVVFYSKVGYSSENEWLYKFSAEEPIYWVKKIMSVE